MIIKTTKKKITTWLDIELKAEITLCECEYCKMQYEIGKAYHPEYKEWVALKRGYCTKLVECSYDMYSIDYNPLPSECDSRFCCSECSRKFEEEERKAQDAARIARNTANSTRVRKERRDAARALRPDPICQYCHQPFKAKRTDAKYCSDYCRQNGHRAKLSN